MKVLKSAAMAFGGPVIGFIAGGTKGLVQGLEMFAAFAVMGPIAAGVVGVANFVQDVLPKPSQGGSQTKWKADPYAGLPCLLGRTLSSGNIVYRRGHGTDNNAETFKTVLSIGPIQSIDTTFMNRTTVTIGGDGMATGTYANSIWQNTQLGACPEASNLPSPVAGAPGWTSAHKLSGLAATTNTFWYDSKSKNGLTTEPTAAWIVHGVKVYDPRLDSTYPGGSGSCRALDESTYVWSEDPHLHALTFALGRWQNSVRVFGIGAPIATIDVASFVEGANLNDARGWKVGGQIVSRPDTPWNNLKLILQAGGAQPVMVGGRITCINRAPRVSLATITRDDIVGSASFSGTQSRRARMNGVIPMYRSEAHDWEMVSAGGIIVADYVTVDGDERTKEIQYGLVQDVNQVAQLARYDIEDSREAGPGTVPLKPWWLNYKPGDCVTFNPEDGWSIKVLITGRALDAQTGAVTYTIRSETDAKHAFALGQTGVAPPTASFSYDLTPPTPAGTDWSLAGATLSANGASIPALVATGAVTNPAVEAVLFDYRVYVAGAGSEDNWAGGSTEPPTIAKKEITSVTPGTQYEVSVRYRVRGQAGDRLILGPVTAGQLAVSSAARRLVSQTVVYPVTSTSTEIDIAAFTGVVDDGSSYVFPAGSVTGLTASTFYAVFRDRSASAYVAAVTPATAAMADGDNIFIGWIATSASDGTYPTAPTAPGGWGGDGRREFSNPI